MQINYPKISIVTPVYNQVEYIEHTISSVISQNYPNLEYIIIDGGSNDGTLDVIEKYRTHLTHIISEPDKGMYDALNKGFNLSTGEIMGWINSDDELLEQSLFSLAKVFQDVPRVNWIQGLNCTLDLEGNIAKTLVPKRFSLITFLNGDYRWIQQESTFWRRKLWEKSGGYLHKDLKFAGDFELWFRFFQHDKLYYVDMTLGAFRKRPGQLSDIHFDKYTEEAFNTIITYHQTKDERIILKKIRWLSFMIRTLEKLKVFNTSYFENKRDILLDIKNIDIIYSHKDSKYSVS